jgi:glycosyltransferase involved in cell wall biosynthesis
MIVEGAYHLGGGIAAVNRLILRSLVEEDHYIDVFAREEYVQNKGSGTEKHPQIRYKTFRSNKILFTLAVWWAWIRNDYSLIFSDQINPALILAPLRFLFGQKYIVWVHGLECFPPNPNWEGIIGARFSKKCLTSSDFTKKMLLRQLPNLSITTCEPALDPEIHGEVLPKEPPTHKDPKMRLNAIDGKQRSLKGKVILHVGRMDSDQRYKGQDVLITAFPSIMEKNPEAQLVLVGGGDDLQRVKQQANFHPPPTRAAIFIPGFIEDEQLSRLYKSCFLFAMPSRAEGFGIVYLEAMRWAKPCIGGKIDAAQFAIQDGKTGLLVDQPSSSEQVAEAINHLFADPERARRMGLAGYNLVQRKYLFPSFKDRFIKSLESTFE